MSEKRKSQYIMVRVSPEEKKSIEAKAEQANMTVEDFEIQLPHDPDAYLENQYGDYMTIPPEAERERHWSIGFCLDTEAQEKSHD